MSEMSNQRQQIQQIPDFSQKSGISISCGMASPILAIAFSVNSTLAQVTPDSTLGVESSIITPNIIIKGLTSDRIDGGAIRGANLFHSFSDFNIGDGERVYFGNPVGIANIFSRVTGNNPSDILGTLGVDGGANLFLLNPNGIIFGENAQLDIRGSFVASTANGVVFDNGFEFSAKNPESPPLLTVNVPIGLQYGATAGSINVDRSRLVMPTGKTLMLVGGDISLIGGFVRVPGGKVELGSVGGTGMIGLNVNSNDLSLIFPNSVPRGNISLTNTSNVNVRADGGGSIIINAHNLDLLQESTLRAGINFGLGSVNAEAGDIEINATGLISMENASFISNAVLTGATGKGGDIKIITDSLSGIEGSEVFASTFGNGDAGNINIQAKNTVLFDGEGSFAGLPRPSGVISEVEEIGVGKGGSVNIEAGSLFVNNGAIVTTRTFGQGDGGNIILNADDISFDGVGADGLTGGAFSSVKIGAEGNAGSINVHGNNLSLANGAAISSSTNGEGNAGTVTINADTVSFDGEGRETLGFRQSSGAYSAVQWVGIGDAGSVNIITRLLSLTNGAVVTATTLGEGNAGSVNIHADSISLDGQGPDLYSSGVYSSVGATDVGERGLGNAGGINITTRSLSVTNGAQLNAATTLGKGDASTININADTVSFDGQGANFYSSGAYSRVESGAVGNGGDINLSTRLLSVTNGAQLQASTLGEGSAGNIQINKADSIILSGVGRNGVSSGIFTSTEEGAIGKGGEITVNTNNLLIEDGAVVNARTLNASDGGSITINANTIEAVNGGQAIATTSASGNAGNITLNAINRITLSGTDSTFANRLAQFGEDILVNESAASGVFANTQGSGSGGQLKILTGELVIQQGALVSAYTLGTGEAGTLTVNADSVEVIGTSINGFPSGLSTDTIGTGDAGDLTLNTRYLVVRDGALVTASTYSLGKGGNLTINGTESIELSGTSANGLASGLYAQAFSDGNAGNLTINNAQNLIVRDGAKVTVAAGTTANARIPNFPPLDFPPGIVGLRIPAYDADATGNAGNIKVTANSIFLNNQGKIIAQTDSSEGGNITLNVRDLLLLRDNSSISTTAGTIQAGGNGGNITINSPFIVAIPSENSDITANAYFGNGGQVNITAQGIYGLGFRPRLTPLSDITASSEFGLNGDVVINTPDIDPSRGLNELPQLGDSGELSQVCQAGSGETAGEFAHTWRGGKPPNPTNIRESLNNNSGWVDSHFIANDNHITGKAASRQIIEAQGFATNERGEVVALITNPANFSPHDVSAVPSGCRQNLVN